MGINLTAPLAPALSTKYWEKKLRVEAVPKGGMFLDPFFLPQSDPSEVRFRVVVRNFLGYRIKKTVRPGMVHAGEWVTTRIDNKKYYMPIYRTST